MRGETNVAIPSGRDHKRFHSIREFRYRATQRQFNPSPLRGEFVISVLPKPQENHSDQENPSQSYTSMSKSQELTWNLFESTLISCFKHGMHEVCDNCPFHQSYHQGGNFLTFTRCLRFLYLMPWMSAKVFDKIKACNKADLKPI